MGTPDFAVPSLKILVESGFDVVAVVTATDKYGGRGNKILLQSAVKKYAVSQNIDVLQPKNLKSPAFNKMLASYKADLQFVVAFRMLPEMVWNMPPMGTYNLHGSLLPEFRGAAPINWAVITGAKITGLTTFKLKHAIDTGDTLFTDSVVINEDETAGSLHDKMMHVGATLVLKSVKQIATGNISLQAQDQTKVSKAPKIFHEDCLIDFNNSLEDCYNKIRGLSPYPAAYTYLPNGMKLKIFFAEKYLSVSKGMSPGLIYSNQKDFLFIETKNGILSLKEIQLEGKRKMKVKDFLNGYKGEIKGFVKSE